jgi:hypothetical protein
MDVLIRGISMPTKGYRLILVCADGTVQTTDGETTAVPVPSHGDLIDRDALMDSDGDLWDGMWGWSGVQIANAPTVIKASE